MSVPKFLVGGDLSAGGTAIAALQKWDFDNALYHCAFYGRERRKQSAIAHCWSVTEGVSRAIKGGARIDASIKSSTNSCKGSNVCSYEVKPVEVYFDSNLKFEFLFFDFEYVWKPEPLKLTEGSTGDCRS